MRGEGRGKSGYKKDGGGRKESALPPPPPSRPACLLLLVAAAVARCGRREREPWVRVRKKRLCVGGGGVRACRQYSRLRVGERGEKRGRRQGGGGDGFMPTYRRGGGQQQTTLWAGADWFLSCSGSSFVYISFVFPTKKDTRKQIV